MTVVTHERARTCGDASLRLEETGQRGLAFYLTEIDERGLHQACGHSPSREGWTHSTREPATLCGRCHALVHDGLLVIEGEDAHSLRFLDASGRALNEPGGPVARDSVPRALPNGKSP